MKLTTPQQEVLKRMGEDGNLEDSFDWFRASHSPLPFMVDDRAFCKVLDALARRKLIAPLPSGNYRLTDEGRKLR